MRFYQLAFAIVGLSFGHTFADAQTPQQRLAQIVQSEDAIYVRDTSADTFRRNADNRYRIRLDIHAPGPIEQIEVRPWRSSRVSASAFSGAPGEGNYSAEVTIPRCAEAVTFTVDVITDTGGGRLQSTRYPKVGRFAHAIEGTPAGCADRHPFEPKTFIVTSTEDFADTRVGDGQCSGGARVAGACSLRAAIMEANANQSYDLIRVPAGRYGLALEPPAGFQHTTGGVVNSDAAYGDLDFETSMSVQGIAAPSARVGNILREASGSRYEDRLESDSRFVKIDVNGFHRGLHIGRAASVRLSNIMVGPGSEYAGLTARSNVVREQGGAVGRGIRSDGRLNLDRVILHDLKPYNTSGKGVALYAEGPVYGTDVAILGNLGGFDAGAPAFFGTGEASLRLDRALIMGNSGGRFISPIVATLFKATNSTLAYNGSGGEAPGDIGSYVISGQSAILIHTTMVDFLGGGEDRFSDAQALYAANSLFFLKDANADDLQFCGEGFVSGGHNASNGICARGNRLDRFGETPAHFVGEIGTLGGFLPVFPVLTVPFPPNGADAVPVLIDSGRATPQTFSPYDQRGPGHDRTVDRDGDGTAEPDIGAYEIGPELATPPRLVIDTEIDVQRPTIRPDIAPVLRPEPRALPLPSNQKKLKEEKQSKEKSEKE
ncbi:MAG: hypothetical protein AAF996_08635 [Pseudomonadota bacterium]